MATTNKKIVRFNEECNEIYYLLEEENINEYRKTFWEFYAIDRCRFRERINRTAKEIDPILKKEHRLFIFNKLQEK